MPELRPRSPAEIAASEAARATIRSEIRQAPSFEAREIAKFIGAPLQRRKEKLEDLSHIAGFTARVMHRLDRAPSEVRHAFENYASSFDEHRDPSEAQREITSHRQEYREVIEGYFNFHFPDYLRLTQTRGWQGIDDPRWGAEKRSKKQEADLTILDTVLLEAAKYVRSNDGASVEGTRTDKAIKAIVGTIIEADPRFASLLKPLNFTKDGQQSLQIAPAVDIYTDVSDKVLTVAQRQQSATEKNISSALNETVAALEFMDLEPASRNYLLREWIRERKRRSESGIKMIDTPYYDNLIRMATELGGMENGLGGKIYYGPVGTSKSLMAVEVNRRQGLDSRMISAHYWLSFSQLFGEAIIKVGSADGNNLTGLMARAEAVNSMLERSSKSEEGKLGFWKGIDRKKIPGMLLGLGLKDPALDEALRSGAELSNDILLRGFDMFHSSVMTRMVDIYEGKYDSEASGSSADTWVEGEILLAMSNKQIPIIDELDKAGPGSLNPLLGFLALEPGREYVLRGHTVRIPEWFHVDATANSLDLTNADQQPLYNRFKSVYVGYPPVKDEMMLAACWMSNKSGVIDMDPHRQAQVAAFFTYMLPEIRNLFDKGNLSQPFSLRNTKEFCDLVVDPALKKDKGTDLFEAIKKALLVERQLYASPEERDTLVRLILGMEHMFRPSKPVLTTFGPNEFFAPSGRRAGEDDRQLLRRRRMESFPARVSSVAESTFLSAVNAMPETSGLMWNKDDFDKDKMEIIRGSVAFSRLDSAFVAKVNPGQASYSEPNFIELVPETTPQGSRVQYHTGGGGEVLMVSGANSAVKDLKIISQSADGRVFIGSFTDPAGKEVVGMWRYGLNIEMKGEGDEKQMVVSVGLKDVAVKEPADKYKNIFLTPDGDKVISLDHSGKLVINMTDGGRSVPFDGKVKEFEISVDARTLLIRDNENRTLIFDITNLHLKEMIGAADVISEGVYQGVNIGLLRNRLLIEKSSPASNGEQQQSGIVGVIQRPF